MSSPKMLDAFASGSNVLLKVAPEAISKFHHGEPTNTSQAECHWWHSACCCAVGDIGMTVERVWALVLAAAMFLMISTAWTQQSIARVEPVIAPPEGHTTTVIDDREEKLLGRVDDWPEPRVDLNGNEIDDAVGDYRVDGHGQMYELHAPDTALLHLSAPKL